MKNYIKRLIGTRIAHYLSRLKKKLVHRHPLQRPFRLEGYEFIRLGSEYGGWSLIHSPILSNSTIVSAGLGEDASFDIEIASRYKARVVIIDPTPRAIAHFQAILSNLGNPRSKPYVRGGQQPVTAYELSDITPDQLTLVDKALWNTNSTLKFYMPKNPAHVSHSITNVANDYREDTGHIFVQSATLTEILNLLGICKETIGLLKLDIEGAEIEVIESMLSNNILPAQLLIEFDDLAKPSKYAFRRVDQAVASLKKHGYVLAHADGERNFLFVNLEQITCTLHPTTTG